MPDREEFLRIYHKSLAFLPPAALELVLAAFHYSLGQMDLPQILADISREQIIQPFLPDLARIEAAIASAASGEVLQPHETSGPLLNPTLQLLQLGWKGLAVLFSKRPKRLLSRNRVVNTCWCDKQPVSRTVIARPATSEDLLLLKMVVEDISPEEIAKLGSLPVG